MYNCRIVVQWPNGEYEGFTGNALDIKVAHERALIRAGQKAHDIQKSFREIDRKEYYTLNQETKDMLVADWELSAIETYTKLGRR